MAWACSLSGLRVLRDRDIHSCGCDGLGPCSNCRGLGMVEEPVQDQLIQPHALLVVDDSQADVVAYRAVLEPLGREVVGASSGEEALRLLEVREFALLLIDVRLPGMDGFETVQRLRGQLRRATPVVFVTGNSDEAGIRRAYEFGAVDYMVKPVHPEILRGKVRNLVALFDQGVELERRADLLFEHQRRLAVADASVEKRDMNIAVVAHDLRSPLFAIVSAAKLQQRIPGLPAKAHALAERIDRSAGRMTAMIRDILDFGRGQLGSGIPLERRPLDLAVVCPPIAEEVAAAHAKEKEIEVELAGDLKGLWDSARIEQAVSNLLTNALQHGGGGAKLRLSGEDPRQVVVEVHNNGEPIPSEQMPGLFEPFRRGDKSPAGLGLGLFIVREIVRAHEGTIDVASAAGGTTFIMRLPRGDSVVSAQSE